MLYDPVHYTLERGGKRIRPYFTLIGCGLCDGDIEEAVPAAVAVELLHNFTLLHDDIMDAAETRRGRPSVFKKWDSSTAILSGDTMYAWAFEQLQYYGREPQFSKEQYCTILDIFLESAKVVCEGQAYDLHFEAELPLTLEAYTQMIEGKTAAMISGAFQLGSCVAAAPSAKMQGMSSIGNHIGIAFQIQDDLLDVSADPSKFGKTRGGDIIEGKKTYLSISSLQRGNKKQKEQLQRIFNKATVTTEEVQSVITLYKQLGVIDAAQEAIKKHYNNAIAEINRFQDSLYKTDLLEFIVNLKKRDY